MNRYWKCEPTAVWLVPKFNWTNHFLAGPLAVSSSFQCMYTFIGFIYILRLLKRSYQPLDRLFSQFCKWKECLIVCLFIAHDCYIWVLMSEVYVCLCVYFGFFQAFGRNSPEFFVIIQHSWALGSHASEWFLIGLST